jgi:hypothetical protein
MSCSFLENVRLYGTSVLVQLCKLLVCCVPASGLTNGFVANGVLLWIAQEYGFDVWNPVHSSITSP